MKLDNIIFRRPKKLRTRLFLSFVILSVIFLLLSWICRIFLFGNLHKAVRMSDINKIANNLAKNATAEDIVSLAEEYALKYDVCISVWDPQLNVIASECVDPDCRVHTMLDASSFSILAKANGGTYKELIDKNDKKNESEFLARVITDDNGDEYLIAVNAVIALPDTVDRSLDTIFMVSAVLILLLSAFISYALSKYMLGPLKKMNKTAKIFAGGDYAVSFDENSYEELSELAKTLNYAANELSTLDTTRNELMANVSHDLKTPLTLISGYAEMIKDFPEEDNTEILKMIISEAGHLNMLVDDMTDISKYNAGVQTLNISSFNITEILKGTSARLCKLHELFGIDIRVDTGGKRVIIDADELKITRVIYNFLNNALTHTGDDNKVYVKQEILGGADEDYVKISITDTGEGVTEENEKIIWDRYVKNDKTYKRAHSGSGLGLNICKSILELHNMEYGVIPIEQMPGNTGCTFWFKAKITKII